eukprot:CAMPEP_0176060264 /NCGR_PEP_ID=MMETSP0120_2-20121206/30035_1 /TAXON_ID=160619 /ORGANISM="Kryptoperidinium foliaceum, Strain CCMP 1326" /LENGTH=865 /DNA_ID=CAMNT_0017393803 /DNA_START=39 /DNA_END=2637 /DNA_ORIENTATION=+
MIEFNVECETVPGQHVAVLGTGPLGEWSLSSAILLRPERYPVWTGCVDSVPCEGVEFKYVLVDTTGPAPELLRWEQDGPNRRADPHGNYAKMLILHHVFGDFSRATVELVQSDAALARAGFLHNGSSTASPSASASREVSMGSASCRDSRASSADASERMLETLQVGPSLRFGRFFIEPGAFDRRYELQESAVLGSGMSGSVRVAVRRTSGAEVAVKTLRTEGLDSEQRSQVIEEVKNQLTMNHPNICRLLEVFEEPGSLRLVMERMRGPDLFDHLRKLGRYTERDAAICVRQMAIAVAHCHRNGVCHRDLKLDNFCLEDQSQDARIKLIDFGLSSVYKKDIPLTNACGTLYYVAPEVLSQRYGRECDMWSLGVITYILLDGRAPFSGRNDRTTLKLIKQGKFCFPIDRWQHISKKAKDFVSKLLEVDVSRRLDAEGALAHPWLADIAPSTEEQKPLDAEVLQSMRSFSKSNALKRAVMRAVAPVATVERVAAWADHFEALDKDGDGSVAIRDLATKLTKRCGLSEAEASKLSSALAEANDGGDRVSYSAFLAACLSAHVALDDQHLRALFDRLDVRKTGTVSVEDVCSALGDVVDIADLQSAMDGKALTFSDFRWLMSAPGHGPSILGLRQLLAACAGVPLTRSLSTRARLFMDEAEAMEASRRENLAWRVWFSKARTGELEEQIQRKPAHVALSLESLLLARGWRTRAQLTGLTQEDLRAIVADELEARGFGTSAELERKGDDELAELCWRAGRSHLGPSSAPVRAPGTMSRTPTVYLVQSEDTACLAWHYAVVAGRDGCVEAARRENMVWRKMFLEDGRRRDALGGALPTGRDMVVAFHQTLSDCMDHCAGLAVWRLSKYPL